jgi:hypothetical protein
MLEESRRRGASSDPLGSVGPHRGVPRDEYETYAPRIASLLRGGANSDEVAAALGEFRTQTMGLPPDPQSDRVVADKIRDWYEHPFYGTGYPSPAEFRS